MRWRTAPIIALASILATMPAAHGRTDDAPLDTRWLDEAWDFDRPAESEARFRGQLESLPRDSAARLELSTQIARAQGLQRQFDAANTQPRSDTSKRPYRRGRRAVQRSMSTLRIGGSHALTVRWVASMTRWRSRSVLPMKLRKRTRPTGSSTKSWASFCWRKAMRK